VTFNQPCQHRVGLSQAAFRRADAAAQVHPAFAPTTAQVTTSIPAAAMAAGRFQPLSASSATTVQPINSGQ